MLGTRGARARGGRGGGWRVAVAEAWAAGVGSMECGDEAFGALREGPRGPRECLPRHEDGLRPRAGSAGASSLFGAWPWQYRRLGAEGLTPRWRALRSGAPTSGPRREWARPSRRSSRRVGPRPSVRLTPFLAKGPGPCLDCLTAQASPAPVLGSGPGRLLHLRTSHRTADPGRGSVVYRP